jgi:hypothetical protein
LISLPTVDGPYLAGVATDAAGFVEVDETLRVCGSQRVWAAGGCIAAALEHSGLGTGQADAAIAAIAVAAGLDPAGASAAPELTGVLLTDQREPWLAENPPGTRQPSTRCLWWPPGRAVGRTLAKRIAAWDPSVHESLPTQTSGVPIHAPIALGCSRAPSQTSTATASPGERAARMRDIENRQLMTIRRREASANVELRALAAELHALATRQQAAIHELQQHGYLTRNRS